MKVNGCLSRRSFYFPKLQDNLPLQSPGSNDKENEIKDSRRKISSLASRIHEPVQMGPKLSETLKGKLSLGARIIQGGGRGNIFKNNFGIKEKEQLLKASQCYLYTTAGPIAGILFISTEKVAFYCERSTTFSSATGELHRAPYKVLIPIEKIKEVYERQNVNKLEEKYIEIVTEDKSDFLFMGFLRYEKALRNLKKAIAIPFNSEREKLLLTS
ncbi:hypothetical protein VNO77_33312 [Canavalia gladiata]|uniref:GRAM domain-containing protein n=1 Tax=Canavalia gladiata TaxID=3824 RepID=A0AAN9KFD2_CANGL